MQKHQTGSSLVGALLVVMAIAGLCAASLSVSGQRSMRQTQVSHSEKAFAAAEAGIDFIVANGNADDPDLAALDDAGDTATIELDNLSSASSSLQVTRLEDVVATPTPGTTVTTETLRVLSTGNYGNENKRVVAFIRKTVTETDISITGNIPTVESAVMLADPFADITLNGNAFWINGDDQNINGTAGPAAPVWGIGVGPQSNGQPGSVSGITSQIAANQNDNVTGAGPDPSVGTTSAVSISSTIAALAPYADVTLTNVSGTYTQALGSYTTNSPQLTAVEGNIHISGGGTGYGVLIVNGNLTISGNWAYVGMILVNGQVTFSGGGNTKKLTGALFVGGSVQDFDVNGNIHVQFSSQAISNVMNWLGAYDESQTVESAYELVSCADANKWESEEE